MNENNKVTINGEITSKFKFDHEAYGEKFYTIHINVERKSGYIDILPVMVSERVIDVTEDLRGLKATVNGEYHSYNKHDGCKNYLILTIFATEISMVEESLRTYQNNKVVLNGTICKDPVYRETPKGREIADIILAVNRECGKSDYIPCICWGRTAKYASRLLVGDCITVTGRVQSREYEKRLPNGTVETRTAYEVSVGCLEETTNEENV